MNYRKAMGLERLCLSHGDGVKIAILDSGVPRPGLIGGDSVSLPDRYLEIPDACGHATAISSILFGGGGIGGLCRLSVPFFAKVLGENGRGSIKSVVKGIYKAIDAKVDLINLSLGFFRTDKCPDELEEACREAYKANIPVICAAGNDGGDVNWPAALKTTICIGASGLDGEKMAFSSSGEVDFVAPGVDLPVLGLDGGVKSVSGTSFATAIATGVAAVLISEIRGSMDIKIGTDRLRELLVGCSMDIGPLGWDKDTGYGLIRGDCINPVDLKIEKSIFGTILKKVKSLFSLFVK